ncbi:hypothetical protein C2845_PM05G19020 [Panicum miliaceum]|uniref:F-box protein AT5G49610-like beta-propeller domain-containing protein n=1 Tax=Panicum miliaceum TaxID=4540 RepID=A0A3L6SYK2_PANMI|nr:hypothetical protein C2845_PM05G19020 [Panicum miliaceum]
MKRGCEEIVRDDGLNLLQPDPTVYSAPQVFAGMPQQESVHLPFDAMPSEVTWDEEMQDDIDTHEGLLQQLALGVDDENTKGSAHVLLDGMSSQDVAQEVCDEMLGKVVCDEEMSAEVDMNNGLLQLLASSGGYPDDEPVVVGFPGSIEFGLVDADHIFVEDLDEASKLICKEGMDDELTLERNAPFLLGIGKDHVNEMPVNVNTHDVLSQQLASAREYVYDEEMKLTVEVLTYVGSSSLFLEFVVEAPALVVAADHVHEGMPKHSCDGVICRALRATTASAAAAAADGETPTPHRHHHSHPRRRPSPRHLPPPPLAPELVRAALACRAFLAAIRSSPAFRRRFRALHPLPLVGFFFEIDGCDLPTLSPVRRRSDADLAAAVRGADVFLTHLPYHEDAYPGWTIKDCHGGCLLLLNSKTGQIATYNPLTRALHLLPTPPDEISKGRRGKFQCLDFFLFLSEENPGSFRVITACHDKSRVRAVVYSSDAREWRILPWSEAAPAQPSGKKHWLLKGTRPNGNLYWAHRKEDYMVMLDTTALRFSFMDVPVFLKGQIHLSAIGETKDGNLCMVFILGFMLFIWFWRVDTDGVERWIINDGFPLEEEILQATEGTRNDDDELILRVWSVMDGIVYLSSFICGDPQLPCWILSFCLETRKLEKLFHRTFDNGLFPYIMARPPSLVGPDVIP